MSLQQLFVALILPKLMATISYHGIRMLKICDKSICNPLELIFQSCMKHGKFPNEWKMTNVVPVHKKNDMKILKYYWPVSLLPICGKIFEPLLYNSLIL